MRTVEPTTYEEAAEALAAATAKKQAVRIRGGATKLGWGAPPAPTDVELATGALDRIVEHNEGDLTAVLEAGVPLARAQETFAAAGQMLAVDPPLGIESVSDATIGGVVATADSGPIRHRYGAPRDLVVGITVALSDGTIARAGGKVIKNVAGYDLPKLFAGSFGTLGLILSVSVRLHPLPVATATARGEHDDPDTLASAARTLAAAPLELEALDVAWHCGRGGILAQVGGAEAVRRAARVAAVMRETGLTGVDVSDDDGELWARQRAGQRSGEHVIVRICARPSALADVLRAAEACFGVVVGRAGLGTCYVEIEPGAVAELRALLPSAISAVVLDAPADMRMEIDPWGVTEAGAAELMRRVKHRFDPGRACNPGIFVAGI